MKAKRLLFLVMVICLASGVRAQFYDGPDDIYYYVSCDENGRINENSGIVYIFNFDGRKACKWSTSVGGIVYDLKKNPNYYEEQVETTPYVLKYTSNNTYRLERGNGEYYDFCFSYSRSDLTMKDHYKGKPYTPGGYLNFGAPDQWFDREYKFKKVDKSFFKVGRSRNPSGTIYE